MVQPSKGLPGSTLGALKTDLQKCRYIYHIRLRCSHLCSWNLKLVPSNLDANTQNLNTCTHVYAKHAKQLRQNNESRFGIPLSASYVA